MVDDQRGAPTWTGRLADLVHAMLTDARRSGGEVAAWFDTRRGLYHASADGETTWFEYARHVLATAAEHPARLKITTDRIEPIPSSACANAATRPANSLLDCTRMRDTFGYAMLDWREDVTAFVHRSVRAGAFE